MDPSGILELGKYGIIGVFLALISCLMFVVYLMFKTYDNFTKVSSETAKQNTDAWNRNTEAWNKNTEVTSKLITFIEARLTRLK